MGAYLGPGVQRDLDRARGRTELLQQFEGTVEAVSDDGTAFTARLRDRTEVDMPDEMAEFELEEVSSFDQPLVRPGAVFYWSIGYRVARHGGKQRTSEIRMRRLPTWSSTKKTRGRETGLDLYRRLAIMEKCK